MSGNGFSGEKKWEEDGTDVILHMQLPHARAEAFRNGVPVCRDVLPALGQVRELLRFHWNEQQGQAGGNGDMSSHTGVTHTPGSGG